jgi:hypothetical protein
VAYVDEVVPVASIELVELASRLVGGPEVPPDHVTSAAAVDEVVAMSAEQLVDFAGTFEDAVLILVVTPVDTATGAPAVPRT